MAQGQLSTVLRQLHRLVGSPEQEEWLDGQLLEAFVDHQDQTAFETLVRRHGPMVLGVCRRILHHQHDAEDAFQAVFLVLFRRAKALDRRGSLAAWLYTVAYHAALKARTSAHRRLRTERQVASMPHPESEPEALWNDLRPILDEELHALPEKYRAPMLLCYVEGKSNTEAARLLNWPAGTVKGRLARAREMLRERLARRGITVTATVLSAVLAERATAAVPILLLDATLKTLVLAGQTGAAALPVARLAESIMHGMAIGKLKVATGVLLMLGLVGITGGLVIGRGPEPTPAIHSSAQPVARQDRRPAPPAPILQGRPITIQGQVADTNGKPIPGARLAVLATPRLPSQGGDFRSDDAKRVKELVADRDGRFRWKGTLPPFGTFGKAYLIATAPGYGLISTQLDPDAPPTERSLRLTKEHIIRGRLLDLQGRPVAAVRLNVAFIGSMRNGMLIGIDARMSHPSSLWPPPVVTDRDGRFQVRGIGADVDVTLGVAADRFAAQWLPVFAGETSKEIVKTLAPAQIVEGVITAEDTGKPIPHARIVVRTSNGRSFGFEGTGVSGTADEHGHFRLNPYPGENVGVAAYPPYGAPYLVKFVTIKWPRGAVRQTVNVRLPRGVLVQGVIKEKTSGRPIPWASVQYQPRFDNSSPLRESVLTGWENPAVTHADGHFALAVLPGPGTLLVTGPTPDFVRQETSSGEVYNGKPGGRRYYTNGFAKLDLPKNAPPHGVNIALQRGVTITGSIIGPDGQPVRNALVFDCHEVENVTLFWRFPTEAPNGRFTLHGVDPNAHYPIYVLDPKNQLGATVEVSGKQAGQPLTVRLQPCGQAVIHAVDSKGKALVGFRPMPEIVVRAGAPTYDLAAQQRGQLAADGEFLANVDRRNYWHGPRTDSKGRCILPALIPGCTYRIASKSRKRLDLSQWRDFQVKPGQTLDLGRIEIER